MKYVPSIWDFENGFFLIDRAREPYFLISAAGQVLRSNKVGARLLKRIDPAALENLRAKLATLLKNKSSKSVTQVLGEKRVLRAVPVGAGQGFMIEIDRK